MNAVTIMGISIMVCCLPIFIIMFFIMYPKKWRQKNIVFGVRVTDKLKEDGTAERVDDIVSDIWKKAVIVLLCIIAAIVGIGLIPDMTVMMILFTVCVYAAILALNIPYVRGNALLKSIKRENVTKDKNDNITVAADLKSVTQAHAVKKSVLFIPLGITAVGLIIALLYDLDVITAGSSSVFKGSFALTGLAGIFLFTSVIFMIIAFVMDNLRNEIVSSDSDVNVNYNRAKKKLDADMCAASLWIHAVLLIAAIIGFMTVFSEMALIILCVAYLLSFVVLMAVLVRRRSLLNGMYEHTEDQGVDDDDNWIFGLIYYNPKDRRLNVEKRNGMGATVNFAHPGGKVVGAFLALSMIVVFVSLIYVGMLDSAEMNLSVTDGKVICHQLRDEYVIDIDEIKEISYNEDVSSLKIIKLSGVGTDKLAKGNFAVANDKSCKTFLSLKSDGYLRIVTDDKTYYINDSSASDTKSVYDEVNEMLK